MSALYPIASPNGLSLARPVSPLRLVDAPDLKSSSEALSRRPGGFARDPVVRREIAMLPIRVGDEATLKASGLRSRIVTVDEFHQRVEIQLLRNGERAWMPYAELPLVVNREGFTQVNRTT